MTSITVRIDEPTKQRLSNIADDFGLDISSITRAFYKQIIREQRIPLNLYYEEPNEKSLESLRQSEEIEKKKPRFNNSKELFNYLGI